MRQEAAVAGRQLRPQVDDLHVRRCATQPSGQHDAPIVAASGATRAVDRGRRRPEHHRGTGQPGELDGRVARLDPRRPVALVRRLVLLVDDHEADVGERREDGQPRPDDDRHRSRPDPPPFVGSLAVTQARMDERDIRVEIGAQPIDERRRERDLGDEHEHRPAGLERRHDGLDVDRGLAPARDALEQERSRDRGRPARFGPRPRPLPARR